MMKSRVARSALVAALTLPLLAACSTGTPPAQEVGDCVFFDANTSEISLPCDAETYYGGEKPEVRPGSWQESVRNWSAEDLKAFDEGVERDLDK